jgi:hypothetical protein
MSQLSQSLPIPPTQQIIVGDGSFLPITGAGSTHIPSLTRPLHLQQVLVSPCLIANLISVRKFTTNNWVSVEFDPFGLSIKDFQTKTEMLRCNNTGKLYPVFPLAPQALMAGSAVQLWHRLLGHTGNTSLSCLVSSKAISYTNNPDNTLCHVCQLRKHVRLPFNKPVSHTSRAFELVHCDLWTSPVPSISVNNYYLVCLDNYTDTTYGPSLSHANLMPYTLSKISMPTSPPTTTHKSPYPV